MWITTITLAILFVLPILASDEQSPLRPIRIALAIDDHSLKDLVILMNSVIESSIASNEDLMFHIVACSKDLMGAGLLKRSIESSIDSCLPRVQREVVAFTLPQESGFRAQLRRLKEKTSHESPILEEA